MMAEEAAGPTSGVSRLGDTFRVFGASENYWGVDENDVATQRLASHHVWIVDGRVERFSAPYRYVWPAELDLMAELAGNEAARPLGRVERGAVYERQRPARVGLGEAERVGGPQGTSPKPCPSETGAHCPFGVLESRSLPGLPLTEHTFAER